MIEVIDKTTVSIEHVDPRSLRPHPRNIKIYGDENVDELKARILASKWIKPLVVTSNNMIISGHRRWRAAVELGLLSVPVECRTFANEIEVLEALLLENASRDKTNTQKAREVEEWQKIEEERSLQRKQIAMAKVNERLGRSHTTMVENFPPSLDSGKTRDKVAERVGFGSGRTSEKAVQVIRTADQLEQVGKKAEANILLKVLDKSVDAASKVLKMPEEKQVAVLNAVATGQAKDIKEAQTVVKREELVEKAKSVVLPDTITLLHGNFLEVGSQIADNSVDLIFTDPPYHDKHLQLWDDLGRFASRVLKPGGMLLSYSGQAFLPQVLNALSEHLDYCWLLGQYHKGQHIDIWKYRIWNNWKPLVLFSKGKMADHEWFIDAYDGVKGDKDAHEWAQGENEAQYFIQKLTQPGALVVDPMCGSGPIVRMAHHYNRQAIGIEIDKQRYDVALGLMSTLSEV